jgi:hypothetical protein
VDKNVLATETAQKAVDAITKDITTTDNNTTIIINESSSVTAPAQEHETPSVAPSESDNSNSLIDDESVEENEDQIVQEWSMFPKMEKLIATLKEPKEIAEIGDEWLDFVDKKIMPACKTSATCVDIDDEMTVASTAASSYSENKTFEDEESQTQRQELVQEFTNVLKKNNDSAFVRSLIKKNPFMRSTVAV